MSCQRGTLELGQNLGLAVLDISETGLCPLVREALPVGQEVSIVLETVANVRPIKCLGKIVWCEAAAEGAYSVDVDLEKRLDYRQFLELI